MFNLKRLVRTMFSGGIRTQKEAYRYTESPADSGNGSSSNIANLPMEQAFLQRLRTVGFNRPVFKSFFPNGPLYIPTSTTTTSLTTEQTDGINLTTLVKPIAPTFWVPKNRVEAEINYMLNQLSLLNPDFKISDYDENNFKLFIGTDGYVPLILNYESMMHWLLVGSTGAGKTGTINSYIWQFLVSSLQKPQPIKLVLVDLEDTSFPEGMYDGLTVMWGRGRTINNIKQLNRLLLDLEQEKERRAQLFKSTGRFPEDLEGYHKLPNCPERLPIIFVIVEEFTTLMRKHPELEHDFETITNRYRKYGIYLLLICQNPEAETLPTGIIINTNLRFLAPSFTEPKFYSKLEFDFKKDRIPVEEQRPGLWVFYDKGNKRKGTIYTPYYDKDDLLDFIQYLRKTQGEREIDKFEPIDTSGDFGSRKVVVTNETSTFSPEEKILMALAYHKLNGNFNINRLWHICDENDLGLNQKVIIRVKDSLLARLSMSSRKCCFANSLTVK